MPGNARAGIRKPSHKQSFAGNACALVVEPQRRMTTQAKGKPQCLLWVQKQTTRQPNSMSAWSTSGHRPECEFYLKLLLWQGSQVLPRFKA